MSPANNISISRLRCTLTQSLLCFQLAVIHWQFSTGSFPLAVFHWQFFIGSFPLQFQVWGAFLERFTCGAQSKSATPIGSFCCWHCKLVSPAQGDGKICSISQKQVCFVSAVAEGCSLNLYFNEMKCNWNVKFDDNPEAAGTQQTKFNARHRSNSR